MCLLRDNIILICSSAVLMFVSIIGHGQTHLLSDQYMDNALSINPATAGKDEALCVSMFYRNKWININGSPKTIALAVHTPAYNRVGLGLSVQRNSYGIYSNHVIGGNYAYRIPIQKGILALGFAANIIHQEEAWNELIANDADDETIIESNINYTTPNFSLGTYYNTSRFFAGLSIPNILSTEWDDGSNKYVTQNKLTNYRYHCYSGYQLIKNTQIEFITTILARYYQPKGLNVDIAPQIAIKERIGVGVVYKTEGSLGGLLFCRINNQINFSYSYGIETGENIRQVGSTHEITLKYLFSYELEVMAPL